MEAAVQIQVSRTEKEMLSENICYYFWDLNNRTTKSKFKYLSTEMGHMAIAIAAITCVLGLLTNTIVIYLTGFKMKKQRSRHWCLNLAVADVLFLLTTPMRVTIVLAKDWTFGAIACKLSHYALVCNMYASSFFITALSIDRVLSVAKPLWHRKIFSKLICLCICITIWLVVLPLGTPAVYFNDAHDYGRTTLCQFVPHRYENTRNDSIGKKIYYLSFGNKALQLTRHGNDTWMPPGFVKFPYHRQECEGSMCCADDTSLVLFKEGQHVSYIFYVPVVIIGYFIPLCVMIFSNLIITLQVRKSQHVNSKKLYTFIAITLGVFVLTKTPIAVAYIVYLGGVQNLNISDMVRMRGIMVTLFVMANLCSCLNPVLYVMVGSKARSILTNSLSSIRSSLLISLQRVTTSNVNTNNSTSSV